MSPTPFVGEIQIFAGNFAPDGWAFCDGSIMSISQNTVLFALIGTTYGGDGQTTFALPDLRGRLANHEGTGEGLSTYVIGQSAGSESVTLTVAEIPPHNHVPESAATATTTGPAGAYWAPASSGTPYGELPEGPTKTASACVMAADALQLAGGSEPHENRPPTLALSFIISLFGVFPSQA